jgi:hypothetical protein
LSSKFLFFRWGCAAIRLVRLVMSEMPLFRPVFPSVFLGEHHDDDELTLIPRAAQRLEPHQRRGAFAVIVAGMDSEAPLSAAR